MGGERGVDPPVQFAETAPEFLAPPLDAHLHRGEADAHRPGDLLVGHLIHIPQDDRDPQAVGHRVQDLRDPFPFPGRDHGLFRFRRPRQLGRGLHGRVLDVDKRFSALLFQVVETMVDLDALEPGAERRTPLVAREPEIGLDEHLLRQVLRAARVPRQESAVGDHLFLVTEHQLFEGAVIPLGGRARALQEFLLRLG